MPKNIELTFARHPGVLENLHPLFERIEKASGAAVQLTIMEWDSIWKDLVNIGIYKRGADISEAGTTWMGSLISMNSLRPFTRSEITRLGGQESFLSTSWETTSLVGDDRVLAIPFLSDARVVFYWRDMLEKAGVAEDTAFSSFENMEETLSRLKAVVPTPWALTTDRSTHDTLYSASSWVWATGEDFIQPGARKTQLDQPAVRSALKTFFGLNRYMPTAEQPMNGDKVVELFRQRQVAAILGGPWILTNLRDLESMTGLMPQLGIALPPGPSFVGGMNLVVWQHTRYPQECVELIRQLVDPQFQIQYCPSIGLMPASLKAVSDPAYSADPHFKVLVEALHKGRVATSFPLWGMVEDKLSTSFTQIWADLFSQPDANLDAIFSSNVDALASRLEITLGG
jgi:multiple sugar transport system substrate-binding protein